MVQQQIDVYAFLFMQSQCSKTGSCNLLSSVGKKGMDTYDKEFLN
jgi:hypothetical protein